jgi:hypothetical protein
MTGAGGRGFAIKHKCSQPLFPLGQSKVSLFRPLQQFSPSTFLCVYEGVSFAQVRSINTLASEAGDGSRATGKGAGVQIESELSEGDYIT